PIPLASSPQIGQTETSVPVIILNYLHPHINFHLHFPRKPDESSHTVIYYQLAGRISPCRFCWRFSAGCSRRGDRQRQDPSKIFFVGQVEAERRNGNEIFTKGPAVGPFFFAFQWFDGEPIDRAFHRIFTWNNFAVVLLDRLTRPTNAFWFLRQVHIDEAHLFFFEKKLEHFLDVRFELAEIGRFLGNSDSSAKSDTAKPEQCGLLGGGQCSGVPTGAAKIRPEIDPGKNKINTLP